MEFPHHNTSLHDDDVTKQRLHLREFRFVPEEPKLASTTGRAEPRRYLKTSQTSRSRPQLLAPMPGVSTDAARHMEGAGPSPAHESAQLQRLSVVPLQSVGANAKSTPQKTLKKVPMRGAMNVRKVSPPRGSPHTRWARRSSSVDACRRKGLHIEGSSVLSTSPGVALQALEHLSECVQEERQLKALLENAQRAKVAAFRAVIKAFLAACTGAPRDDRTGTSGGGADGIAVARCSVVTNALVVVIQSYLRAIGSSRRAHSLLAATGWSTRLAQTAPGGLTANQKSATLPSGEHDPSHAFDRSLSTTRNLEDLLDMSEINQLKQLYFDFYDCEVVSLGSDVNSEFDGDSVQRLCPPEPSESFSSTEESRP